MRYLSELTGGTATVYMRLQTKFQAPPLTFKLNDMWVLTLAILLLPNCKMNKPKYVSPQRQLLAPQTYATLPVKFISLLKHL